MLRPVLSHHLGRYLCTAATVLHMLSLIMAQHIIRHVRNNTVNKQRRFNTLTQYAEMVLLQYLEEMLMRCLLVIARTLCVRARVACAPVRGGCSPKQPHSSVAC